MTMKHLVPSLALLMLLVPFAARGDELPRLPSVSPDALPSISTANVQPIQSQTIDVTCYLGNPTDRNTLGSITVYSVPEAGTRCNELYYPCRGACFGCFSDFDLSGSICVDAAGKKFLW